MREVQRHKDGKLVGRVEYELMAGKIRVVWAWVDPDYRGQGLAREMFEEVRNTHPTEPGVIPRTTHAGRGLETALEHLKNGN